MGNRCAKFFVAVFIPILAAVCSGCSLHSEQSYDKNGVAMDTAVYLKATGEESKEAVEEGFARIRELDKLASSRRSDSDISRIRAAAG